jgi:RNA polymerase sigma-70 factor, ECF subfamily
MTKEDMAAQRADELIFAQVLPVGTPEEHALAQAFKRGEEDAYRAIHERYAPRVHSVCRRMLHNPDDAAEAAQEAFLRIYQGLARFNGRYRLGAWMVRVTTNVCLDQLRARSRRPSDPTPFELLELESAPVEGHDPEILFMRHAEGRKVRKILNSLPPLHRAAIVLRDFEGISYAEIAETLELSECQVKALLHRARRGFRKNWTEAFASLLAPLAALRRFVLRPLRSEPSSHLSSVSQATESAVTTSQQALSGASQAAAACSGVIQQCGQFMADRAAPVVAAFVVGTATVGTAAVVSRPSTPSPAPQYQQQSAPVERSGAGQQPMDAPAKPAGSAKPKSPAFAPDNEPTTSDPIAAVPVHAEPVPTENPIVEEPLPTPSPSPTPAPSPPAPDPTQKPVYKPVLPAVGFDWGRPIPNVKPVSNYVSLSCQPLALEQRLETVVEDDDAPVSHPALLSLRAGDDDVTVGLTVEKNGSEIPYTGIGKLIGRSQDGDLLRLEYEGSYETWNREAENIDLPLSGQFKVALFLDCATATVIQEAVTLGA